VEVEGEWQLRLVETGATQMGWDGLHSCQLYGDWCGLKYL
jgi:hypothetical protein